MYKEKLFHNFREIVCHCAKQFKDKTAFVIKNADGSYLHISFSELKERYYRLCNHFLDLGLGGQRIAVIGKNSFDWVLSYLCAATVGVVVPLDVELHENDVTNFLKAAGCKAVCYAESAENKLSSDIEIQKFPFGQIRELSAPTEAEACSCEAVDSLVFPKDKMQILIFTSGTTGNSKGVCLSQYNICKNIHSTVSMVKVLKKDIVLSILPLHHTYECTLDCLLILSRGATITYCEGLLRVAMNIKEYSPTILVVVPALLKALHKSIKNSIVKSCPPKYKEYFLNGTLAEALAKTPWLVRKLICKKVKKGLGGRLRLFIVGAADLDTYLVEDFNALGIRTLQGYGLTECAPLLAGNSDFWFNAASTGREIPGVSLKIDDPDADGVGEILAKGDNLMLGYFNDEQATKDAFRDGWFHTGDLGYIDSDGFLYIKGRKKNVIVTSNGKNIYPEEIETLILEYPEVSEALVVSTQNNGDISIKAKLLPNIEYLKAKIGRLPTAQDIQEAIADIIEKVNSRIPAYKQIKIIDILTDALEKTTTHKIKRFGQNLA